MIKPILLYIFIGFSFYGYAQKRLLKKADKYYASEDYLFAERLYEQYVLKNDDPAVREKLLDCYKIQSKSHKVNAAYDKLISNGNKKYALDHAKYLLFKKQYGDAKSMFNKHLDIVPNDSVAIILRDLSQALETKNTSNMCAKNEAKPYRARFSAAKSIDPENPNISFLWQFDDGDILKGVTVTKTFETAGRHSVILSAKDLRTGFIDKNVDTAFVTFDPNLTFDLNDSESELFANEDNIFEVKASTIDNRYVWDFGDGSFDIGSKVSHAFKSGQPYYIYMYRIANNGEDVKGCVVQKVHPLNDTSK